MDLYEKYGVDKTISQADFLKLLDEKKQITLRKLNNIFDNPEKEAELKKELDQIEATELIVKSGNTEDPALTGLLNDNKPDKKVQSPSKQYESESDEAVQCYREGSKYYDEGDYEEALRYYRKAANLGHVDAQYSLAYLYSRGLVATPKDGKDARYWYGRAAEQGHLGAMNNLAIDYAKTGFAPQVEKAISLWTQAAEKGLSNAMDNLGSTYLEHINKQFRDYMKAYYWLTRYKNTLSDENEKKDIERKIDRAYSEIWFTYTKKSGKDREEYFKKFMDMIASVDKTRTEEFAAEIEKLEKRERIWRRNDIIKRIIIAAGVIYGLYKIFNFLP